MLRDDVRVLTLEEISSATDRQEEVFQVPEWGASVIVRPLSLKARDLVISLANEGTGKEVKLNGQKLIRLLVLYGVEQPKLTEAIIEEKAFAVIDRIATHVMKISGMAPEAPLIASRTF